LPFEQFVLFHMNDNVEIAVRSAASARFALPGESQPRSSVDTGGGFVLPFLFLLDSPLTAASGTEVCDHSPPTAAVVSRLADGKESLLKTDLSGASANAAGDR